MTVCISTQTDYVHLLERSIPSVPAPDYRNIEVFVVGDAAPPETVAGIEQLNDPRVPAAVRASTKARTSSPASTRRST